MGRSVALMPSEDLGGHSCPGVCLSQELEGNLETGDRAGVLCPVSTSKCPKGEWRIVSQEAVCLLILGHLSRARMRVPLPWRERAGVQ